MHTSGMRDLVSLVFVVLCFFFFFNDTATTEIYTLSLHDALPIYNGIKLTTNFHEFCFDLQTDRSEEHTSELQSRFGISYAVFCLKKKKSQDMPCRYRIFSSRRCSPTLFSA